MWSTRSEASMNDNVQTLDRDVAMAGTAAAIARADDTATALDLAREVESAETRSTALAAIAAAFARVGDVIRARVTSHEVIAFSRDDEGLAPAEFGGRSGNSHACGSWGS